MGACQLVIRLEISGRKCQPSQAECPGLALQGWPVLGLGTPGWGVGGACPTKTEICPPCRNVQGAAVSMPCRLKSLSHIEIKFSDQVQKRQTPAALLHGSFCTREHCAVLIPSVLPSRRALIAVIRMGAAH